jgi:hypothetical protein
MKMQYVLILTNQLTATAKENLDKLVPVFTEYPDTDITILDILILQVLQIIIKTF